MPATWPLQSWFTTVTLMVWKDPTQAQAPPFTMGDALQLHPTIGRPEFKSSSSSYRLCAHEQITSPQFTHL